MDTWARGLTLICRTGAQRETGYQGKSLSIFFLALTYRGAMDTSCGRLKNIAQ